MVICFWLMDWRFPKIDQILSKMIFSFPYMITNYLCFLFSFQVSLKNGSDGEIRWAWSQNCSGNILVIGFTKFYFNPFFILGCFERIFLVSKKNPFLDLYCYQHACRFDTEEGWRKHLQECPSLVARKHICTVVENDKMCGQEHFYTTRLAYHVYLAHKLFLCDCCGTKFHSMTELCAHKHTHQNTV